MHWVGVIDLEALIAGWRNIVDGTAAVFVRGAWDSAVGGRHSHYLDGTGVDVRIAIVAIAFSGREAIPIHVIVCFVLAAAGARREVGVAASGARWSTSSRALRDECVGAAGRGAAGC
jgi:hypothetical protein